MMFVESQTIRFASVARSRRDSRRRDPWLPTIDTYRAKAMEEISCRRRSSGVTPDMINGSGTYDMSYDRNSHETFLKL